MVVYRVSTNWRQKMQDDAEIGLAVLDFNRISDGLVCNKVFPFSLSLSLRFSPRVLGLWTGGSAAVSRCLKYGTKLATA